MSNEINILFTGDFYPGRRIDSLVENRKFELIFNDLLEDFAKCNLFLTNMEAPITTHKNPITKTGPALKANPLTIEALKYAGINLVTLANNHIGDYGKKGLDDTFLALSKNNIEYIGAGSSYEEASKVLYKDFGGYKIGFINIAENEWSTTIGKSAGANPLNPFRNYSIIQEAKRNVNYLFLIIHGGHELYHLPSPGTQDTYRFYIDAGVDAIIAHHPHYFSGYEIYKKAPIFYSLGNFIFDKGLPRGNRWNTGYAVRFNISGRGIDFSLIPYFQNDDRVGLSRMNSTEHDDFNHTILSYNYIINDRIQLESEFDKHCQIMTKSYNSYLEPYSSRFLHALRNRGLIPHLLSKRKKLLYTNLIRCESHRELLLKILEK